MQAKTKYNVLLFLGLVVLPLVPAGLAVAMQTKLGDQQMKALVTPVSFVRVLTPDGWRNAAVDGSMAVTKVNGAYVISASPFPQFVLRQKDFSFVVALGGTTVQLPDKPLAGTTITLVRNGLVQTDKIDYTINGNTITLLFPNLVEADDTWLAKYFF